MQLSRTLEQSVAVFGESGSGKTVLLSSFYGAAQEPKFLKESLFRVVADDIGQGSKLHRNYLGMKDEDRAPAPDRFSQKRFSFSIKLRNSPNPKASKSNHFDALRLVWHDYPGEWFEHGVSSAEEGQRRVDTFRTLLSSDVAIFLVDGQQLLNFAGEEERYLRSLFGNFRNALLSLKDDLLVDGAPLAQFPRIWMMGLSKVDLLPEIDVYKFRDLLIGKAGDDIDELRRTLEGFVEGQTAFSIGEDFVLLSSAKFEATKIDVDKRVGVNLILPLAAILPFERHVRWARNKRLPRQVAETLVGRGAYWANALAAALTNSRLRLPGPLGLVQTLVGAALSAGAVDQALTLAESRVREINKEAIEKHNYLTATLTGFRLELDRKEQEKILLRSLRCEPSLVWCRFLSS